MPRSVFKPGQPKPAGSGRKKGTPNRDRALLVDVVTKELGVAPIVEMCRRYKSAKDDKQADRLLIEITSYCHPKPKAIEHTVSDESNAAAIVVAPIDLEERLKQIKGEK